MRTVAIAPIRLYQLVVSPWLPANTCKFHPSCSEYAVLAIRKHGICKGVVPGCPAAAPLSPLVARRS